MSDRFSIKRITHATLSRALVAGREGSQIHLHSYNATSDKAAGVLKFRTASHQYVTTAEAAASQAVVNLDNVDGLAGTDVVLVQPKDGAALYVMTVSSITGKAVTMTGNFAAALPAGSKVFRLADHSQVPCGAATISAQSNGSPLWVGDAGMPLILELDSTSAGAVNAGSGQYAN